MTEDVEELVVVGAAEPTLTVSILGFGSWRTSATTFECNLADAAVSTNFSNRSRISSSKLWTSQAFCGGAPLIRSCVRWLTSLSARFFASFSVGDISAGNEAG